MSLSAPPPPPHPTAADDVFARAGLPRPTAAHYPTSADLPWHFSFIDGDAMIGGSSAPTERRHWAALAAAGVGLVVNLTEAAVSPPPPPPHRSHPHAPHAAAAADDLLLFDLDFAHPHTPPPPPPAAAEYAGVCAKCGHVDEVYDADLFADVVGKDIEVLFLPIPDGSVPRFEQLNVFLKEADKAIKNNKKVIVHCQAGVGRTGTFLAIYLINKYHLDPLTAITLLRHYRPQSLQFHATDWQVDPFRLHPDPKSYNRNMVQERFVERWYHAMMKDKRRASMNASMIRRGVPSHDDSSTSDSTATTTSHDYASHHKSKRRTSFVMENTQLIPDEQEPEGHKPKPRRRHTDSAATYDNFMDYLVALSKQQHQAKATSLLQPQVSQLAPVSETSDAAFVFPTTNNSEASSGSLNNKSNLQSMLSSSLHAMTAYPTPPRTSEISSSFKRIRESRDTGGDGEMDTGSPAINNNSHHTAPLSSSLAPQHPEQLSNSFSETFSKLSSSSPNPLLHPYSRHQHSYHHRKRHPKPILHHQPHNPSSSIPKQSSFTISSILLKLIDQQLDAKFTGFTTSPCVYAPPSHSEKPHASRVIQIGACGVGLPKTREVSRTLCYGCRGVVSVGPEPIQIHPSTAGTFELEGSMLPR
ncbi:hypothetical protein BDR26DRAFT_295349 [Obelidium mucronatum]|nr:hypothetical protein BDR26DRAFT_295349 [Obelidium mucronatum]